MGVGLAVAVVVVALAFAWTNGFHDASTAVATSLASGALTPRVALVMAASLNVAGGLLGVSLARAYGTTLIAAPVRAPGVALVAAALLAGMAVNLVTWWFGLPTSSTHALLGGLAGAGVAAGRALQTGVVTTSVVLPLLLSPVLAWLLAASVMRLLSRPLADVGHAEGLQRFRMAQTLAAAATALGHGLQDAQKTMAVVMIALVAGGHASSPDVPFWLRTTVSLALGLGTLAGGWRLIRTVGRRIAPVGPVSGFTAQAVTAGLLYLSAGVLAVPISTTQTVVGAVAGAAGAGDPRVVRWRVLGPVALAWVLTPLVAAALAALAYPVVDLATP